jgi:hypothetical protein
VNENRDREKEILQFQSKKMIFGRDIWFIILHYLPLEDLLVFSFVSKQMKAFCHDDYFWGMYFSFYLFFSAIKFAKTGWTIPPSLLKRYPNISIKNLDDVKDKIYY